MSLKATHNFTMPVTGTAYTTGQVLSAHDQAIISQYPAVLQANTIEYDTPVTASAPLINSGSVTILPSTALTTAGTSTANTVVSTSKPAAELVIKTTAVTATPTLTISVQVPDGQGGWATAQTLTTSPTAAAETAFDLGPQGATPVDITGQLKFIFVCSGSGAGITFLADLNQ